MSVGLGDRVKSTHVEMGTQGTPYITRYGTVTHADPEGSYSAIGVRWDDGKETFGFHRDTVVPINLQLRHPEPLAYLNPFIRVDPNTLGMNASTSGRQHWKNIRKRSANLMPNWLRDRGRDKT